MRWKIEDEESFRPFELRIRFDSLEEAKELYNLILEGNRNKYNLSRQMEGLHKELGAKITLVDYK